ncbi:hypothetical protein SLS56_009489 [Neofusicoccum ribis]|uniref:Uncharacterized protein n=1 Tax=Neofusicoccum ribis TaxID=45134 RepID=A0ABR3SI33_9PEZI
MHRWTARTYISMCSIPRDHQTFQVEVPPKALQFDWLLNSIFALSALDLASTTPPASPAVATYARAAIEYYDASVQAYRRAVGTMTRENHDSLFCVGFVVAVYAVAAVRVPPLRSGSALPSVLAQVPQFFDLLSGTSMITVRCRAWLVQSMESVRIVRAMEPATAEDLDDDAREAMARLLLVNDRLHTRATELDAPLTAVELFGEGEAEAVDEQVREGNAEREMYKRLIPQLVRCFAEDVRGIINGFCLAFPAFAGREFKFAVERSKPMALLVLMYWAVCLEHHGRKMWWANGVGKRLIVEITEVLERSDAYWISGFWEAVAWARQRVDLPGLLLGSHSYEFDVVEVDSAGQ